MTPHDAYRAFLERKVRVAPVLGFDVADDEINSILKGHQRAIVRWAVQGGRRAIFAAFGLGKSVMQIEILRLFLARAGGRGLIVAPLGVRQEFIRDGRMLDVEIRFIRSIDEAGSTGIYITNYETVRDGKLDPNEFTAASLDEAAILASYGSKTFQTFMSLFAAVRFRFVATATPSPNRYKELIHYAGYLGIMDTGLALTRWFQRDSTKANNLTLYPHKEAEFWHWLNTWAIFLQRPSDLGYSDAGYILPDIKVVYHEVETDLRGTGCERDGQGLLLKDTSKSLSAVAREKRDTMPARIARMVEILQTDPDSHYILWHDLEGERLAIEAAVPGVVSVYGTQDLDEREQAILDFSEGRTRHLAAKPVMLGSGTNLQRYCHKEIFLGIGFKFRDFIQAIHRVQRFGQTKPVEIHIIYAESEREVLRALQAKWVQHNEMVAKMSEIIREHGLSAVGMAEIVARSIGVKRIEVSGAGWRVVNNDCVDEARRMPPDSVGQIVTSIPFANHYEYTPSFNDFGHTDDNDHFWEQMDFLTVELLRVLKPGRLACIHVKDRVLFGNVTGEGVPTISPFHAETIFHFRKHGFQYMGLIHVNTDVVRENNQTYRLGYTEMCKDGTKMGVGCPEYVVLMRKPQSDRTRGYADDPVVKSKDDYSLARWQIDAHAFWRSSGNRLPTPDELAKLGPDVLVRLFTAWSLAGVLDHEEHVRIGEELEARGALPSSFMSLAPGSHDPNTWHDVNRMLTLNTSQSAKGRELHVCPLQLDIVDRLIRRFSNPGDLIHDPFGGLMTVPVRALKLGRTGSASELHAGYFLDGVKYLRAMENEVSIPSLFDLLQAETPVAAPEQKPTAARQRRQTPPSTDLLAEAV